MRVRTGDSENKINSTLVVCVGDESVLTKLEAACAAHELRLRIDTGREMPDQDKSHGWVPLAILRWEVNSPRAVVAKSLVRSVKGAFGIAGRRMKPVGLNRGRGPRPPPGAGPGGGHR